MDNDFKALFAFSKKERAAIYILLLISSLVWLIPGLFYRKKISPVSITVTPLELEEKKGFYLIEQIKFGKALIHQFQRLIH